MLCKDIMRRPVACARRGETVQSAAGKMRDCHIGFLPVCDDRDRVVGVLTDRDIAVRMCAAGELPAKTLVEAIMTIEVVSCSASADVREAERLMARERKSRILVVGDDGKPEGVISLSDLAGHPEADVTSLLRLVAGREVLDRQGVTQPRS